MPFLLPAPRTRAFLTPCLLPFPPSPCPLPPVPPGPEDMQVSTSPYGVAAHAAAAPSAAAGRDLARAAHALGELDEPWVTVFGFGPADLPLVIREFSRAGDIVQVGWARRGAAWVRGWVRARWAPRWCRSNEPASTVHRAGDVHAPTAGPCPNQPL